MVGSSFCEECVCSVAGCTRAKYDSNEYCFHHRRIAANLKWELLATRATRSFAHILMPCDVLAFLAWFPASKDDFAKVIMLVLLKEPAALQAWMGPGSLAASQEPFPGGAEGAQRLHLSLIHVATAVHEKKPTTELKQLCKQGVGRFMGSTKTIQAFHAADKPKKQKLQQVSAESQKRRKLAGTPTEEEERKVVLLGLGDKEYHVREAHDVYPSTEKFLRACQGQASQWRDCLEQLDRRGDSEQNNPRHADRRAARKWWGRGKMLSVGYVRKSIVRKVILGPVAFGELSSIDWSALSRTQLQELCPDQAGYVETLPETWTAQDISRFVFDRDDWAMFVSCFACLWHDVPRESAEREQSILEDIRSGNVEAKARAFQRAAGHAFTPADIINSM